METLPQSGRVWFPDSSYKTSQTIADCRREKLPLLIMANWRGFSGGTRDMYQEVLKFGSMIVDELRDYPQEVYVYLPPYAQLRGGSMVVITGMINPDRIKLWADPSSSMNILEPEGLAEIRCRDMVGCFTMMVTGFITDIAS